MDGAMPIEVVIGSYARLGGRGLTPLAYHPAGDAWSIGEPVPHITDASHGVYSSRFDRFYFVAETDHGSVSCHARRDQDWSRYATATTGGSAPCHCALDPEQGQLVVANYESGSIALYTLD